jgi:hypothetical protein
MNNTAITKFKFEAPKAFGSNAELNAIIERMAALCPVKLDDWQLGQPEIVKNLDNAYLKAAQLSVFYRLVPGVDVYILPFGNAFAVDLGISSWQKAADRYASKAGITYHVIHEELSQAEIKDRRGEKLYTPQDVGYRAYLWRNDKSQVYEMFGGKQAMTQGVGLWVERARYNNKKNVWEPDTIPAQRSKQDVAKRRATKAVLKAEFSLDSLLAAAPNEIAEQLQYLDMDAKAELRRTAIMQRPSLEVDEDGMIVAPSQRIGDVISVEEDGSRRMSYIFENAADEFDDESKEEWGEWEEGDHPNSSDELPAHMASLFDKDETAQPGLDPRYKEMAEALTGGALTLLEWGKTKHADSQSESTLVDYRILAGEIDKLIGKHNHNLLLSVLLGFPISSQARPGDKFVRFLLAFIRETLPQLDENGQSKKDAKGRVYKNPNPQYNVKFVDAIKDAWSTISHYQS